MAHGHRAAVLFTALIALVAASCGESDEDSTGELRTIEVETSDGTRAFQLYEPDGLDGGPVPLVIVLHGHGASSDQVLAQNGRSPSSLWLETADEHGVVIAVPDGLVGSGGDQGWNDCRGSDTNPDSDDVAFLEQLIWCAWRYRGLSCNACRLTPTSWTRRSHRGQTDA